MKFKFIRLATNRIEHFIAYVSFTIYSILYAIFILSIFELTIFPTIKRITYSTTLQWSVSGSVEIDILVSSIFFSVGTLIFFKKNISIPLAGTVLSFSFLNMFFPDFFSETSLIIFISSLPVVLTLTVLQKFILLRSNREIIQENEEKKYFKFQNFLRVLFSVFVILQIITFITWLIYLIIPEIIQSHWSWEINLLDTNIFYSFGLLSPILLILSMFSFFIKPVIIRFLSWFKNLYKKPKSSSQ